MAYTGNIGNMDYTSAYAQSFGALSNGTVYQSVDVKSFTAPKYNVDIRSNLMDKYQAGIKALHTETGGAGTAGFALIPIYVDPQIVDITRKWTPLVELIPRRSNMGMTADYNVIEGKGGGYTALEDAALPETNTTYDRESKGIKFLYSVGRVTGPAQAAVPPYMLMGFQPSGSVGSFADSGSPNAMQQEVLVKTREIRELEENLIINGDSSSDATEFDGLITQISTTNTVDKNTSALSLDDINTAIKNAYDDGGRPNLAICSSGVYTDLLNLLSSKIGYMQPQQQVFWGFNAIVLNTMVGAIPVIPSMFMSNDSGSKSIYFLDMSVIEMRVLQDLSYEKLAKNNDSEKFMLKIYETLIVRAPTFCSSITEISA
jgi:hypothetical protein